jgi:phosphatidylglycerophosphatase GEP4
MDRRYFIPHLRVHSVTHIDYKKLHAAGIRHIVFDKDNTLTAPYARHYPTGAIRYSILEDAAAAFGLSHLAIISNSAGSSDDKGYKEAVEIEKTLGLAVIRHELKKPNVLKEIMDHFKCIEEERIAIVGDRILADIVMGNQHGFFTIYVDPVDPKTENFMVKLTRKLENNALPLILPREGRQHALVKEIVELKKL